MAKITERGMIRGRWRVLDAWKRAGVNRWLTRGDICLHSGVIARGEAYSRSWSYPYIDSLLDDGTLYQSWNDADKKTFRPNQGIRNFLKRTGGKRDKPFKRYEVLLDIEDSRAARFLSAHLHISVEEVIHRGIDLLAKERHFA